MFLQSTSQVQVYFFFIRVNFSDNRILGCGRCFYFSEAARMETRLAELTSARWCGATGSV